MQKKSNLMLGQCHVFAFVPFLMNETCFDNITFFSFMMFGTHDMFQTSCRTTPTYLPTNVPTLNFMLLPTL